MKRVAKMLGYGLLMIILLSFVVVQFFGANLSLSVIDSLNRNLNTEITVDQVSVSLLRSFPKLSVNMEEFTMLGSDGTPLLEAKEVACKISLSSLFGKTKISTIVVSDGALQIYVDPDGNNNYHLLEYKPVDVQLAEEKQAKGGTAAFAIDDARLENVELIYQNDQLGLAAAALVYDANFRGDFGREIYDLATQANAEIRFIDNGNQRILPGQSLRIGAESRVNNAEQSYEYKELYLGLGGLNLRAEGHMQQVEDGWDTDLRLESEEGTLTDLLRLIPEEYLGGLKELQSRGKFSLSGTITERWTEAQQPKLDFKVAFAEGKLSSRRLPLTAKELAFVGQFSNGRQRSPASSSFYIEKLSGTFGRDPFDLSLRVDNLEDPTINFGLDGSLALEILPAFLPEGMAAKGDGRIRINALQLSGRVEDMLRPRRMGRVKSGGTLSFEDASIRINDRQIEFPDGRLLLRDNELEIDNFQVVAPGNDITFIGQAKNLIPVLFADSLNTQDAQLEFRALLQAKEMDIDELLALAGPSEEDVEAAEKAGKTDSLARKSVARRAQITDLLNGQFEAKVDAWNYGEMEGENFLGQLTLAPKEMKIVGQSKAMDGVFQLDGELFFTESPRLEARIIANKVDVKDFFRQSENFGQEVLMDKHLKGELDSRIFIRAYFDQLGALDYDRLLVLAGLKIDDGELKDFEILENFSAVLKQKDLARVRFSNLNNYLEISNNTVYIPAMFIQSSAMNMTVSGSHTFSHVMDYNLKVNAGQVLANKIARHDRDLEILPARRRGFFNLYYTITGNLDNYEYQTNKRKVKAAFKRSEDHRRRIRVELERQFEQTIPVIEEPVDWRDETEGK
ncbi:MAG: AsmA-like C-terminal region-containing protein [Bacteroidota bacterium]